MAICNAKLLPADEDPWSHGDAIACQVDHDDDPDELSLIHRSWVHGYDSEDRRITSIVMWPATGTTLPDYILSQPMHVHGKASLHP